MRFMNCSLKQWLFATITALGLLPASALAQDARGKFTLNQQVQWGMVSLPPGDYSYAVEHQAGARVLVRSLTGGPTAIVLASSLSEITPLNRAQLQLELRGDDWVVTSLALGAGERTLYFNRPSKANPAYREKGGRPKLATLSNP